MDKEILKKFESKGLVINRIPEKYRELFKSLAKEEFCNDYGMTLRELLVSFFDFQQLKTMFLNNDLNVQLLLSKENPPEEKKVVKNLRGEEINLGGQNE